jgi:hypothetical protein
MSLKEYLIGWAGSGRQCGLIWGWICPPLPHLDRQLCLELSASQPDCLVYSNETWDFSGCIFCSRGDNLLTNPNLIQVHTHSFTTIADI